MKDNYVTPFSEVHEIELENTILDASNEKVEEKTFTW